VERLGEEGSGGREEEEEDDCTVALSIDPKYFKARLRRGLTR